jgi:5,6-dimethylbenzimidazole synthase
MDLSAAPPKLAQLGRAQFDDDFRRKLQALMVWRRDVRRFRTDPLPRGALERLIQSACLAPSVGLSQPWRFVVVDDAARRRRVIETFTVCNAAALQAYDEDRQSVYARLKLAGLQEAPCHLALFADLESETGHGLGRQTMPQTLEYSVVAAIGNLWLTARADGIGVGWISILDPAEVSAALDVPPSWKLIGYFCLGLPDRDSDIPELEREGWERRRPWETFVLRR